jgi:tetratricopeptide (TPR) repeat protein
VAVLNAHLHAPPPRLTSVVPELPSPLEQVLAKALSKSPLDRYGSCGDFLTAARAAAAAPVIHRRRLAVSVALLALAAAVGAAAALLLRPVFVEKHHASPPPATATTAVRPRQPTLADVLFRSNDGRTLNDVAFALIGIGDYARAVPFARKAVAKAPAGSLTKAYATYNLGLALLKVNRCGESLMQLRRALLLEPKSLRRYIRPRIRQAKSCARRGASARAPSH